MAVKVDEHGYVLTHSVKTTAQARSDLTKAAIQLRAVGREEAAEQLAQLARQTEIYLSEQEQAAMEPPESESGPKAKENDARKPKES